MSSDRSDAVVLGGGVELIWTLDSELRAASAAAAAGGLLAAMDVFDIAYGCSASKYLPDQRKKLRSSRSRLQHRDDITLDALHSTISFASSRAAVVVRSLRVLAFR